MKIETLKLLKKVKSEGRKALLLRILPDQPEILLVSGEKLAGPEHPLAGAFAQSLEQKGKSAVMEIDGVACFGQLFYPPLRLLIIGAVHISQALAPMAARLDYAVTIIDPRGSFATPERFPDVKIVDEWPDDGLDLAKPDSRTAVVTLTHDPKLDDPALDKALASEAFYIAALGSKKNHRARLDRLEELGHDRENLKRIHGPAGLDLGAVTPEEIALSILAEMTSVLRRGETLK